jgi:TonB family protein
MQGQLFTLLPSPRPRLKSFVIGWGVQALSLASLLFVGTQVHQNLIADKPFRVTNLVSYEPPALPQPQPVAPRVAHAKPLLQSKPAPQVEPLVETTPAVAALVVTPQVRTVPQHKTPDADPQAPDLKIESKMPVIPNAPPPQIVAVGTFGAKSPLTAAAKPLAAVQTGGFGDVNGIAASAHGTATNINAKGSPSLPLGFGPGNATSGTNSGVVMKSGFGNLATAGTVRVAAAAKPVTGVNAPVEITFKPKPDYTDEGRKQKINGEVRLQVLFSTDGRVHVVRVLQGLGYGLDEQAVKAAERMKFKPALHEGQPVDSTALVHIIFELIS